MDSLDFPDNSTILFGREPDLLYLQERAEVVYQQHKGDLVGRTGEAVGSIFKSLSSLGGKPSEAVGSLVKEAFGALASANRDLLSGGITLPRLQREQARDLIALLQRIASLPVVLVLDQWEKSPNLSMQSNILEAFLRQLEYWPMCHIFLGVRAAPEVTEALRKLQGGFCTSPNRRGCNAVKPKKTRCDLPRVPLAPAR